MWTRWLRIAWALPLLAAGCAQPEGPPERILLIVVDTLRRDSLPVFGGHAKTPNLTALAERGATHEAVASFHQTTMSMGALFTGRTPSLETGDPAAPLDWLPPASCGMGRFMKRAQGDECIPPELTVLGEALRGSGYHTVGVVANRMLFDPAGFSRGFDRWEEIGQTKKRRPKQAAKLRTWQQVNDGVRRATADLPEAPLFLYVHYLDVHDWLYRGMSYTEAVEEMDRGIGDLFALLEARKLLDGTAILLTSDHGELIDAKHVVASLPLHFGNPSYRDVLDVPLLLVGFEDLEIPPLSRSEDLHHLLLARAGAPRNATRDLAENELFLTEVTYQTYQRGRFKSLQRRGGQLVLVDLESDPEETRDVAARHPEVVASHRERVAELTESLAAKSLPAGAQPSEEWLDRLRALGYAE